ncbi:DgyrCDS6203 [Dimorphilus gyrociliatus]|uniref:DgyrCDS6203 n=1 Tax=Dimorphilus gyrociliatus TaxID=2664684 RepID=A0A7I8VMD2_9ANNE|nr:DgyrCDS6203 [Dimorphilus gyrociliatus]
MPVIDPSILQTIVGSSKNLNLLSRTHSSNLQAFTSSEEPEKSNIKPWVREDERKNKESDNEENFQESNDITLDKINRQKCLTAKDIKEHNQINGFDNFERFKTGSTPLSFEEGFRNFKKVNSINEDAVKKNDIVEESINKKLLITPTSPKKVGRYYDFEELYSLRNNELSKSPPKGRINWDVMVLLLPEVCLKEV